MDDEYQPQEQGSHLDHQRVHPFDIPPPDNSPSQFSPKEEPVPSHSTLENLHLNDHNGELLFQAKRVVTLHGDLARESIRLRARIGELEQKLESADREANAKVARMLAKRFSEMKPNDIPLFDPRYRMLLWFNEYQQIMKTVMGDVSKLSDRDFKRLRMISEDMRKEGDQELRAKYGKLGVAPKVGRRGGRTDEEKAKVPVSRWAKGAVEVPDSVEVSAEMAAAMNFTGE